MISGNTEPQRPSDASHSLGGGGVSDVLLLHVATDANAKCKQADDNVARQASYCLMFSVGTTHLYSGGGGTSPPSLSGTLIG